ncbi:response regulator [Porticoccus sp.]|uniref:response regulator n=1 Tax=Porticoccus sp. TaxID=2024853 RepID=UPI003F69A725
MQILLVEDDQPLAQGLKAALGRQHYSVNHVDTGRACLHVVETEPPDIIILDIGLPDMSGLKVLESIRSRSPGLPVLLLTARDTLHDKVTGLDSGADDYLAKPFEMSELLARLRVLERRLGSVKSTQITIGPVVLDNSNQSVTCRGEPEELTRREYMLLKALMENAGRVMTRNTLETKLYSWGEEICSNTVEVHVHHLRKKLGTDFIRTVRGVGYKVNTT